MVARADPPVVWEGAIPLRYEYTAGVAGERFLRALKAGRLLLSRCRKCLRRYVPPRAFCVHCFRVITEYNAAPRSGYVYSYTTLRSGKAPRACGLIRFKGVEGGLLHLLEGGPSLRIGMKVAPVFKPPRERRGALTDIVGFLPLRAPRR